MKKAAMKAAKKASKHAASKTSRTSAKASAKAPGKAGRPMRASPEAGSGAVDAFMATLKHPYKAEVEALRAIIKGADKRLVEQVKWNAPSYAYKIDMGAFNPWEQGKVMFIFLFPKGKLIEDPILGDFGNRRLISFRDMAEVKRKKAAQVKVIKQWMKLVG